MAPEPATKKGTGGAGQPVDNQPPLGANPPPPMLTPQELCRGTTRNAIARIHASCQPASARFVNANLIALANLLQLLEQHWKQFNDEHRAILRAGDMTEAQYAEQERIMVETERHAMDARNAIQAKVQELTPAAEVVPPVAQQPLRLELSASDLTMNQNTWGKFDGDMVHWQSFRDKFIAAVHENERIRPVFKLQHLMAALQGPAARVVGTRPPTEDGYQAAWARLCEVYNDDFQIVRAILRSLFAMPTLENPTQAGLRRIIDTTHEATRQLRSLGVPVEHWDQILVHLIIERLDEKTANDWMMQRNNALPTIVEVSAFLERRARSLCHAQPEPMQAGHKRKNPMDTSKTDGGPSRREHSEHNATDSSASREAIVCKCCDGAHHVFRCEKFMKMTLEQRRAEVYKWKLCKNCLKPYHPLAQCKFGECIRCHEKHNSTLCPKRYADKASEANEAESK